MVPGVFGAGVTQLNLLISTALASLLPGGSVSYLYYADRVTQLPLGVVGAAIATALLPVLTRQLRSGAAAAAQASLNRALECGLALTLPAMAGIALLAQPIVAVLFERGAFERAAATATADALTAFALGLPAYVLIKVLAPAFFAREDTATPVKVALAALALNLLLNLALMSWLAHVGIALATSIAAWVNAVLLAVILRRRGLFAVDARLRRRGLGLIAAVAAMALALGLARHGLGDALAATPSVRAATLAGLILGGAAVFTAAAQALGALDLAELWRVLRRGPSVAPAA
jgi:putative peptidoglycan lipid II flippase